MNFEGKSIQCSLLDGGIAELRIDLKEDPVNKLNKATLEELGEAVADRPIRHGQPVCDSGGRQGRAGKEPAHGHIGRVGGQLRHRWPCPCRDRRQGAARGSPPRSRAGGRLASERSVSRQGPPGPDST